MNVCSYRAEDVSICEIKVKVFVIIISKDFLDLAIIYQS